MQRPNSVVRMLSSSSLVGYAEPVGRPEFEVTSLHNTDRFGMAPSQGAVESAATSRQGLPSLR